MARFSKDTYVGQFRAELRADLGARYASRLRSTYSTLIDAEGFIRDRLPGGGDALGDVLESIREIFDASELDC